MKRIKVVLLDDEVNAIKSLRYELSKYKEIHIVHEFDNPHVFLEKEAEIDYHGLFLDIDMPKYEINGIDIAQKINKPFIFVTAHSSKYANEVNEIRDLGESCVALIPKTTYKKELIENAILKLHKRLNLIQNFVEWNNTTENKSIEIKDIQVISTKDYSKDNLPNAGRDKFLYRNGKKHVTVLNKNLDECLLDLPPNYFFKVNDSHVVNKSFIQDVNDKDILINVTVLEDGKVSHKTERIKISPVTADKFKAFYYTKI
jgi:DNA-binding LytR/AlgR family response regulator